MFNYDDIDMKQLKKEQLDYFKEYAKMFRKNTKEYKTIMNGIRELEKFM